VTTDPLSRPRRIRWIVPQVLLLLAGALPLQAAPAESRLPGESGASIALLPAAEAPSRELVLDRRQRRLLVLENGQELRRFPVAVGMPGWETPVGRFEVIEMRRYPVWQHPANGRLIPPGPANPLGSRWIGFHRDCNGRRGFNGQENLVVEGCVTAGFHGTPNRASVGQAVSHGCVRLYDEHVQALYELVQVGTPVTVLP
jgi:lipoprotein-anchoring transpeptidase ErfK/SrfK